MRKLLPCKHEMLPPLAILGITADAGRRGKHFQRADRCLRTAVGACMLGAMVNLKSSMNSSLRPGHSFASASFGYIKSPAME